MQGRVDGDEADFCPVVVVGQAVERLENRARGRGDHAAADGLVRDVDEEDVHWRLRRPDLRVGASATLPAPQMPLLPLTMYSRGAMNSTTEWLSSGRCQRSAGWFFSWSQSKSCGTSLLMLHMQHFQRLPPSMNCT